MVRDYNFSPSDLVLPPNFISGCDPPPLYEERGGSHPVLKSWCEIETIFQLIWFCHLNSFWGVTPLPPWSALWREGGRGSPRFWNHNHKSTICLFLFICSGEPCFQGRPIHFWILMPSPLIHTKCPVTGCDRWMLCWPDISVLSDPHRVNALLRDESLFYCSSTPDCRREGICSPIWHFCHTESATR